MKLNKQQKLLKNKLNKVGSTIEPQGTPDIFFCKLLPSLFIRAHCFLLSKHE